VTLVALFYAEEDWRGKRVWEQCKHDLEAKGIALDWDKYIPPAVPDDQNFFKAPKMQQWFVKTDSQNGQSNELTGGLQTFKPVFASDSNPINTEAEARDYLALSDQFTSDFNLIREALKRPYARMDGDYSQMPTLPRPDFVAIRSVVRVLAERAHCYFILHQPDKALSELALLNDLRRMLNGAPTGKPMTLVAAMINVAVAGLYAEVIEDGFRLHAFQEPQLVALQEQLKEIHLVPPVVEAFDTEPAASCRSFQTVTTTADMLSVFHRQNSGILLAFVPRGWIYQNLVNVVRAARFQLDSFDPVHDSVSPSVCKERAHQLDKFLSGKSPFKIFAAIATPNFLKAVETTARNQNFVNEALVACALERYHLAHGEYPESLDALVPLYLDKLPHDIIGGQPLKYRRTGNAFLLYSIGWNETDDGGIAALRRDGQPDPDNGDWVWKYSAK